jgi:protein TonB
MTSREGLPAPAGTEPGGDAGREREGRRDLDRAELWLRGDPHQRRLVVRALVAAIVLHAAVLVARMPDWGPDPVRVDAAQEQAMKVQFLRPPPPPKAPPRPPEPVKKKIPRPDPTPDEPEPIKEAPPPAPEPSPAPVSPQPVQTGPIRVAPGQGPGLVKKVDPQYPAVARTARLEGTVVVDAIIRADGTVGDVKVLNASNRIFEQAVIDAVRQWRYSAGGQEVILTVTVNFTLR